MRFFWQLNLCQMLFLESSAEVILKPLIWLSERQTVVKNQYSKSESEGTSRHQVVNIYFKKLPHITITLLELQLGPYITCPFSQMQFHCEVHGHLFQGCQITVYHLHQTMKPQT